ncbi:MAG: glycosyltransferase family 4 protein [Limisphaerales bacterium]
MSGVGRYVVGLAKAMMVERPDIKLHIFTLPGDEQLFEFPWDQPQIITVEEKYRSPIRNVLWHQRVLPREAERLELDLIHTPSYRRMSWSPTIPSVGTIHDLISFHEPRKSNLAQKLFSHLSAAPLARRQHKIIASSNKTAADIERFLEVPSESIAVIPKGIDHGIYNPGDPATSRALLAKTHGLPKPFFLYVSRLDHPARNHVRLLEAFELFKRQTPSSRWQLLLGGADGRNAEVIHQRAAGSQFKDDIHFFGFVADDDLPDLYRAARAFVFPSLFEGFGQPPLEAMACGCPVISSRAGSLDHVLGVAATTIDPLDVQDIAEKLAILATDDGIREMMIEKGVANAGRFNWRECAREVAKVYDEVSLV